MRILKSFSFVILMTIFVLTGSAIAQQGKDGQTNLGKDGLPIKTVAKKKTGYVKKCRYVRVSKKKKRKYCPPCTTAEQKRRDAELDAREKAVTDRENALAANIDQLKDAEAQARNAAKILNTEVAPYIAGMGEQNDLLRQQNAALTSNNSVYGWMLFGGLFLAIIVMIVSFLVGRWSAGRQQAPAGNSNTLNLNDDRRQEHRTEFVDETEQRDRRPGHTPPPRASEA